MAKFLHIGFAWVGQPKTKALEPLFNRHALDWVRYASNCWIVWTNENPGSWFDRIKPHLGPNDQLLISELDRNIGTSQGWMPAFIWDWINKSRL